MTTRTIDRQRVLIDTAHMLAAAPLFLLGVAARYLWRLLLFVWIVVLWLLGAFLAGWEAGGGQR